jgi:glycosyltransferase involved in cell wall biosynthesis
MRGNVIRVGVFDQIVSGGGVRQFTLKLLEEFSRLSNARWHFHLMWPLFDSSNNFLPRSRLKNVSFERINSESTSPAARRILPLTHKLTNGRRASKLINDWGAKRLGDYAKKKREHEQQTLRALDGRGLQWLDKRIDAFDLIYMPYPYLTLPLKHEWRPTRPVIITLHDLAHEQTDVWGEMTEPLQRELRNWTESASLVIFSSDFIKTEAQKIYGLPEDRARRVYLCPPEQSHANKSADILSRYPGLSKGYLLTLGWAAKHKRVQTIVEGFALFKKRSGRDVPLVIAGPHTESLSEGDTCGLKIGKDVFALGYVRDEEIASLYKNSSLVVTASISEAGLNSMIFDAMHHGRAVVCSDIPQFVERLGTDNSLALTFDPYSPESLCDALLKHFANPERARTRVENARRFVSARTLSHVGQDYLNAFQSVLCKRADVNGLVDVL